MIQPITNTECFDEYRELVQQMQKRHEKRTVILYYLCAISVLMMCVFQLMLFGIWFLPMWMVTVLANIGVAVLGMNAVPEKPRQVMWLYWGMLAGVLLFAVNVVLALAAAFLYLGAWKDSRKAVWLSQQPGYPYFNERFMLQQDHYLEEYDSEHDFSERLGDEMIAIEEIDAEMEVHNSKTASEALLMEDA